jgi:Holliday junction resolvase RusA-like endonuclease
MWQLVIHGNPATKKTSNRLFRVRGRTVVAPSAVHDNWFRRALPEVKAAWRRAPLTEPVSVKALFFRADGRRVDLVNLMQALADLLERGGVVKNDQLIRAWDRSRLLRDPNDPRIELVVSPLLTEDSPR